MRKKILCMLCILFVCVLSVYVTAHIIGSNSVSAIATNNRASEVQKRLKEWGYYNGAITGVYDSVTVSAIKKFQSANNIEPTGAVGGVTANALGIYISEQESTDLNLLARCIHAEARGESYTGKVAVGAVILNRVASKDFPNTVYGVIYQPWAFTCVNDGQINLSPDAESYQAAQDAMNGWDPTYGSLYYYNPKVATSKWIYNRQTVTVIGDHVFAI